MIREARPDSRPTDELEAIRERRSKITGPPWAWEQYGEKENCYHIGIAVNKDGEQVLGRVTTERYDEDRDEFIEDILWKSGFGELEGAINYDDADFIAHAPTDIDRLFTLAERLTARIEELEADVEKQRDEAAAELEIKAASVVLCPNCNGQRTVSRPPWVAGDVQEWNNTSLGPYGCPTCGAIGYVTPEEPPRVVLEERPARETTFDEAITGLDIE